LPSADRAARKSLGVLGISIREDAAKIQLEVFVTDVRIRFWSLVMLSLAGAAVPAFTMLMIIGAIASMARIAMVGGGAMGDE
jgi:hypothetical protein